MQAIPENVSKGLPCLKYMTRPNKNHRRAGIHTHRAERVLHLRCTETPSNAAKTMLPIHSVRMIEALECVNSFTSGELRVLRIPTPITAPRVFATRPTQPYKIRVTESAILSRYK
jgi:hypothetical protein